MPWVHNHCDEEVNVRLFRLTFGCVFVCVLALSGLAQVSTSRLDGIVQDASGAVVPNAKVTALNNKTQVRAETTTGAQGFYVFPSLQPGDYTLTVEAAGFRKAVHAPIVLNVGVSVTENVKLEVGQVAETVTVVANLERIQTSESHHGRVITMRDIDVLPQLGRTPIILAVFQPGVQINPGDVTFSRVNGLRQGSNNAKLDGIDVNDAVVPRLGLSLTANNTDSVGEFRIITEGGKAEYGRSAGAQVELITRSGTNDWHGGGFDYLRNTVLHANNFFNNSSGVPRPKFIQNIFGGSLGGPVFRDKTFIFGNYQGRRVRQEIIRNRTVLTPEAKAGIFRWRSPGSTAIQQFNIVQNDPRRVGIDRLVAENLKLLPDPNNFDVGDGLNTAGFRFNNPNNNLEDQFTIRGDHVLWSTNRIFYRHSWQRNSFIDSLNNADARYPGQIQGTQGGSRWGMSLGSDWTITPRLVNEFRYGHQSASVDFRRPARLPGAMLLSNTFTDPLNPAFAQGRNSPVDEFTDNLSLVRGPHTIKAGFNGRWTTQFGYTDAGIYPNVTFAVAQGNVVPANVGPSGSTISSADRQRFELLYNDLLGRMSQVTQTFYSNLETFQKAGTPRIRNYKFREFGLFLQDDWKVRPNLTLNLGLRYEFFGVPFEGDQLQGTVDKAALINSVSQISDLKVQRSNKWYNNDLNNFAPRIGLSWDPWGSGKMAIRANYGVFYDRIIGATTSLVDGNTPGFSQAVPVFPNQSAGSDVRAGGSIPLPAQPAAPVLQLPATRSTSLVVFKPDLRTGYVHQYSLSVQREIVSNTVLEVAYVGNRGVKLFMDLDYNQQRIHEDFLTAFRQLQAFRSSGAAVPATNSLVRIFGSPAAAVSAIGAATLDQGQVSVAATTVDRVNFARYQAAGLSPFYLRNYPQYNQVIQGRNDGRSYYDSLQLSLRRTAGAVRVVGNYTFSKSIDNISVDGNGFTSPIDNFNLVLNKARGDGDRTHSFNYSAIYTLPFGRGHRFGGNWPRWMDALLGGWELGSLGIWQSGPLYDVSSGRQTGPYTIATRANYAGDRNVGGVMRQGNGVFFLTPEEISRFSFPVAGEIGSSGRNAFRGPRFFGTDLSVVKRFKLTERQALTFRAEVYNLFNNVNFGNPGTNLTVPASFGRISGTVGSQRIMQMALRYDF